MSKFSDQISLLFSPGKVKFATGADENKFVKQSNNNEIEIVFLTIMNVELLY